jgi:hypothetical protein
MTRAEKEKDLVDDQEPDAQDLEEGEDEDVPPTPAGDDAESSLDELLAKREKSETEAAEEPEEEVIPPSAAGKEERVETLSPKVVPQQPTEFTCRNCFLVKHRSQLANKKKMLCRDCA